MHISHKFHPIDKNERLLSVANDIEVLHTQAERGRLEKIGELPKIHAFWWLLGYFLKTI